MKVLQLPQSILYFSFFPRAYHFSILLGSVSLVHDSCFVHVQARLENRSQLGANIVSREEFTRKLSSPKFDLAILSYTYVFGVPTTSTFLRIVQGCHAFEAAALLSTFKRALRHHLPSSFGRALFCLSLSLYKSPRLRHTVSSVGYNAWLKDRMSTDFPSLPWNDRDRLRVRAMQDMNEPHVHTSEIALESYIELRPGSLLAVVRMRSCRSFQDFGNYCRH